jgi:hypothetical protein
MTGITWQNNKLKPSKNVRTKAVTRVEMEVNEMTNHNNRN